MKRVNHAFNVASHAEVGSPETATKGKHNNHAENVERSAWQKPFGVGTFETTTEFRDEPSYVLMNAEAQKVINVSADGKVTLVKVEERFVITDGSETD